MRRRDGYDFYGCRLRVELAKGRRSRDAPRGREGRAPNTGYRVLVKGLPTSASWQDLKDFFRQVTRPAFTDVVRDRDGDGVTGIVEFDNAEDMDRAIRKLDDTEFRNPYDRCYVRLFEDQESRGRGSGGGSYGDAPRGRSRSPRRRSRSPRPRSRSRTRSPVRGNNDDNDDSNYNNDRRTLPQLGSPAPAE